MHTVVMMPLGEVAKLGSILIQLTEAKKETMTLMHVQVAAPTTAYHALAMLQPFRGAGDSRVSGRQSKPVLCFH